MGWPVPIPASPIRCDVTGTYPGACARTCRDFTAYQWHSAIIGPDRPQGRQQRVDPVCGRREGRGNRLLPRLEKAPDHGGDELAAFVEVDTGNHQGQHGCGVDDGDQHGGGMFGVETRIDLAARLTGFQRIR